MYQGGPQPGVLDDRWVPARLLNKVLASSRCYTASGRKVSPARAAASLGITVLEEHPVGRAPDTGRTPVQDVGVDHRCAHVPMAEQFLDGPDVVTLLSLGGRPAPRDF